MEKSKKKYENKRIYSGSINKAKSIMIMMPMSSLKRRSIQRKRIKRQKKNENEKHQNSDEERRRKKKKKKRQKKKEERTLFRDQPATPSSSPKSILLPDLIKIVWTSLFFVFHLIKKASKNLDN